MLDALVSDVKIVGVCVLIRNLSLPVLGREVRLVLETQTGLRKSDRLSTLARGGPCEAYADDTDETENPAWAGGESEASGGGNFFASHGNAALRLAFGRTVRVKRTVRILCPHPRRVKHFGGCGRRLTNRGTDHGHANVMLLLGGGVRGGKVYGQWPGLDASHLYENRDLAVTTDFRDVFAEVLSKRMGVANLAPVFPRYPVDEKKRLGIVMA